MFYSSKSQFEEKKSGFSHWEISVACTSQEYGNFTRPYYPLFCPIICQVVAYERLKTKKNFNPQYSSPVPELSFLPAPYRGWTRAGERRVQDNLHTHAQNAAIFSPQIGVKTIFGSIFQIWLVARFSEW